MKKLPAISGARMDQLKPNVWIKGEKITGKLSDHPVYRGSILTKASPYDTQVHHEFIETMIQHPPNSI
ncbi:MAG: hypothetical protein ACQEWV_12055 [Bacillota bacterium]